MEGRGTRTHGHFRTAPRDKTRSIRHDRSGYIWCVPLPCQRPIVCPTRRRAEPIISAHQMIRITRQASRCSRAAIHTAIKKFRRLEKVAFSTFSHTYCTDLHPWSWRLRCRWYGSAVADAVPPSIPSAAPPSLVPLRHDNDESICRSRGEEGRKAAATPLVKKGLDAKAEWRSRAQLAQALVRAILSAQQQLPSLPMPKIP